MPLTKKEAREKHTMLIDELTAQAEYLAALGPHTSASVWQEHIGVMVSAAEKLAGAEAVLRRTDQAHQGETIQ